jgi:hypothetical protein
MFGVPTGTVDISRIAQAVAEEITCPYTAARLTLILAFRPGFFHALRMGWLVAAGRRLGTARVVYAAFIGCAVVMINTLTTRQR